MNNDPLVSVIVSTYNSEKFFKGKLEDLLNQTILTKLEIIVVNSGSKQNEDSIIKPYLDRYNCIKYIHTKERETIYKAWNRGIKIAKGKYITNANTDDRLKNDALEILAGELDKNEELGLVFANQYISNVPNQTFGEIKRKIIWPIPEFDYQVQLDRCVVLSQPMWRATLHYSQNIWFDERYEICGDHEFILNLMQHYNIKYLPIVLGVFYVDKNRSNKSLQSMKAVENEKLEVTSNYILTYIQSLDKNQLITLRNKFKYSVKIPVIFLRGKNIIQKYLFPGKHPFTSEFSYYVMALVEERLGNTNDSIHLCNKILKRKKSLRVENLLTRIKNQRNDNITNK